jgi:hypothetical protein
MATQGSAGSFFRTVLLAELEYPFSEILLPSHAKSCAICRLPYWQMQSTATKRRYKAYMEIGPKASSPTRCCFAWREHRGTASNCLALS